MSWCCVCSYYYKGIDLFHLSGNVSVSTRLLKIIETAYYTTWPSEWTLFSRSLGLIILILRPRIRKCDQTWFSLYPCNRFNETTWTGRLSTQIITPNWYARTNFPVNITGASCKNWNHFFAMRTLGAISLAAGLRTVSEKR